VPEAEQKKALEKLQSDMAELKAEKEALARKELVERFMAEKCAELPETVKSAIRRSVEGIKDLDEAKLEKAREEWTKLAEGILKECAPESEGELDAGLPPAPRKEKDEGEDAELTGEAFLGKFIDGLMGN